MTGIAQARASKFVQMRNRRIGAQMLHGRENALLGFLEMPLLFEFNRTRLPFGLV